MIECLPDFPDNVIAVACHGHVTRGDYESVLVPRVEAALARHESLRLYYRIGEDFDGVDAGAVWEDFKIGIGHLRRWQRIAVVTDVAWIRATMKLFGFIVPGEMRLFPVARTAEARDWIVGA